MAGDCYNTVVKRIPLSPSQVVGGTQLAAVQLIPNLIKPPSLHMCP